LFSYGQHLTECLVEKAANGLEDELINATPLQAHFSSQFNFDAQFHHSDQLHAKGHAQRPAIHAAALKSTHLLGLWSKPARFLKMPAERSGRPKCSLYLVKPTAPTVLEKSTRSTFVVPAPF
jgi:hypothetical protein